MLHVFRKKFHDSHFYNVCILKFDFVENFGRKKEFNFEDWKESCFMIQIVLKHVIGRYAFNVLEIFHCFHLQFHSCRFVTNDNPFLMHLKHGNGP